jgi:hypothetical protein
MEFSPFTTKVRVSDELDPTQAELDSMKASHMHELDALRRQIQVGWKLILNKYIVATT